MRRIYLLLFLTLTLAACTEAAEKQSGQSGTTLVVGDGTSQRSYTVGDLQALSGAEAAFAGVTYRGVPLPELLRDAGFDVQAIRAIKALGTDGYSFNYEPTVFRRHDVLVAYARSDGPLAPQDGLLRMVVPDAEGKLNVRMLAELRVLP